MFGGTDGEVFRFAKVAVAIAGLPERGRDVVVDIEDLHARAQHLADEQFAPIA